LLPREAEVFAGVQDFFAGRRGGLLPHPGRDEVTPVTLVRV